MVLRGRGSFSALFVSMIWALAGSVAAQDGRSDRGITRPTPPTPPQITAPGVLPPQAIQPPIQTRAQGNTAQNSSIFRAAEGQRAAPGGNAGSIPQNPAGIGAAGNNAGGPGNTNPSVAPAPGRAATPAQPGQVRPRAAIRPDMNAVHRQPASLLPAPPSYRPPPPGVVHNPPSGRAPPPILRQQPNANGKATATRGQAPLSLTPRSTAATAPAPPPPAAIPPGFRPVPPRAPAFRVMPGMQGPRRPTPPGGPAAAAAPKPQQFECTPERVAARMCR